MLLFFISILLSVILLFTAVAFVTLLERKLLAYSQSRIGPNNILFNGILQPLIDGVNLLQNTLLKPANSINDLFFLAPFFLIILIVIISSSLCSTPFQSSVWSSSLMLILLLSLGVYGNFLSGLSSASNYSFVGGIRSCLQSVSYEVSLAIIIFSFIILSSHLLFSSWSSIILLFSFPLWFISLVAETNRAPFDLAEGESELISGLNIEISSILFALILVGEYGILVIFSWLTSTIFFFSLGLSTIIILYLTLFIRSVFPRYRYDNLIALCWTNILPLALFWLVLALSITQC